MVRRAVPADAAEVTRLRRLMFESMGLDCDAVDWEPACVAFFEARFGTADVVGARWPTRPTGTGWPPAA